MSNFLSFLKTAKVTDAEVPVGGSTGGPKKQRNPNPTFFGVRVWKDGSVYPSRPLAEQFDLEYQAKGAKIPGNGFDVIDTRKWVQMKAAQAFIAIGVSTKGSPKLDLFSSTKYKEDGAPISSVLTQGATAFGASTLLPLLKDIYNVEPNEEGFIDLAVVTDKNGGVNFRSSNGIELLPKVITRGDNAGKADYAKRENIDIFALVPREILEPGYKQTELDFESDLEGDAMQEDTELPVSGPVTTVETPSEKEVEVTQDESATNIEDMEKKYPHAIETEGLTAEDIFG